MEKVTFETPALYGDHHVIEVRRILLEVEGIEEVYASSAFKAVEITFDSEKIGAEGIKSILDVAGYLDEITMPVESGEAAYLAVDQPSYFRHTAVYETSKEFVSFAQNVSYSGRPLWNCPGMGVIKNEMED